MALLEKFNTDIIEPLKIILNREEEEKKKVNTNIFRIVFLIYKN